MKKYHLVKVMFSGVKYCIAIGTLSYSYIEDEMYDIYCMEILFTSKDMGTVRAGTYTVFPENMLETSDSLEELHQLAMLHIL